jgi:hypothetical protein
VIFVDATGRELRDFREDFRQFALNFLRLRTEFRRARKQETDLRSRI